MLAAEGYKTSTHVDKLLKLLIFNSHVFYRVEKRDTLGEPALDLQHALPYGIPGLLLSKVLGKHDSQVADGIDGREEDRNNLRGTLGSSRTRLDPIRRGVYDVPILRRC